MPLPAQLKISAVEDLAEAYAWYETQREGLGEKFLTAVQDCLASVARHPRANAIAVRITAWRKRSHFRTQCFTAYRTR